MLQREVEEIENLKKEKEKITDVELKSFIEFSINQKIADHELRDNSRGKKRDSIKNEMLKYQIYLNDSNLMTYNENGGIEIITPEKIDMTKEAENEVKKK